VNTGEAHENILAYPAFADSAVLQKVEQEREEEYFLPDKRYAAVENGGGVRGEYDSSRFEKKANGTMICPLGERMELKSVNRYEDGQTLSIYEGMACEP
jgi:hypothetical protein